MKNRNNENIKNEIKLKWLVLPAQLFAGKSDVEVPHPALVDLPAFVGDHCRKLLSIDGKMVCVYYADIILEDIALKAGEIINHAGIILQPGVHRECHANCAKLWRKSPEKYKLVTGYALSEGIWVNHSWLHDADNNIIETILPADLYHGVVMDNNQSEDFCKLVLEENNH